MDPYAICLTPFTSKNDEGRLDEVASGIDDAVYENIRLRLPIHYHESDVRKSLIPDARALPFRRPLSAGEVRDWIRSPKTTTPTDGSDPVVLEPTCCNKDACFFMRNQVTGGPIGGFVAVAWKDTAGLFLDTRGLCFVCLCCHFLERWNISIHVPSVITRESLLSMISVRVNEPGEFLLDYTVPKTTASMPGLAGPLPYFRPNILWITKDSSLGPNGYRVDISKMVSPSVLPSPHKVSPILLHPHKNPQVPWNY